MINPIQTRMGMSYLDMHGIVHTGYNPGVHETLADAQESVHAALPLFGGVRRPLLVDLRSLKSQDRDARSYYASPEVTRNTCALGLLVSSRVSMVLANFFLSVTKTSIPSRMFTDEDEAITWLKGFRA